MARYLTGQGVARLAGPSQAHLATLTVNILGGLLMGLLVGALALKLNEGGERWRLLLGVGALGGYTTFSAFSLDAVQMLERRQYVAMFAYVVASVVVSILALMLGLAVARRVFA